jgi:hypothetical protein
MSRKNTLPLPQGGDIFLTSSPHPQMHESWPKRGWAEPILPVIAGS